MDKVAVRFHYGGEFSFDGNMVQYIGGSEGMSHIERDLISLPEIVGHIKDHAVDVEGVLLHWLFPGKNLDNGLKVLSDDKVCQLMSDSTREGQIAEVFVEAIQMKIDALVAGQRRELEETEMDIEAIINLEDDSDDVQFIGERKCSDFPIVPVKQEEPIEALQNRHDNPMKSDVVQAIDIDNSSSDSDCLYKRVCHLHKRELLSL
ncbi:hypothetical protein EJB05_33596, partial [Eragrostis curvula]